ncbi:MAG: fibronectin type III domain-containing protein [Candidatus Omnitrophica bacterium]|nr:fibronectin type III domain-containing protein [Candidatus Omnitrophota bacterium]
MRFYLFITLLLISGCTTMDHSRLISPSESLYHKANRYYEDKNFSAAIDLYEEFLEAKPRSDLATPAKLNLGMSYYYSGNHKQAYSTLKEIDLQDANIKEYIDGILKICEAQAGDDIRAEEQVKLAASATEAKGGKIQVEITDAYMDDFGSVVLTGKTNRILTVFIDGKKAALDGKNMFTAAVSWRKGRPISVAAKDESGGTRELDYFPDGESPKKPEGLSVTNSSSNSIEIEWNANSEDDIKGYRLFYRLKGGSIREVPGIITRTKHEVVGLQGYVEGANRTFEFYVRAVDKMNNESEDSNILEADLP